MKRRRPRRNPVLEGWVCPSCGQTRGRHGRGGARACKAHKAGPTCPGLVCECGTGICYSRRNGWTRSPCEHAHCYHCGWTGTLRSRAYERDFGLSRCPVAADGRHRITPSLGEDSGADVLHFVLRCVMCTYEGHVRVGWLDDVEWIDPAKEKKDP